MPRCALGLTRSPGCGPHRDLGTGIGTALLLMGVWSQHRVGAYRNPWQGCRKARGCERPGNKDLSWKKWARRVDEYLQRMNSYLWPDLIIVGGGSAKKADKFLPLLTVEIEVVAAQLENDAGIVGAALAALYAQPPADEPVEHTAQDTS